MIMVTLLCGRFLSERARRLLLNVTLCCQENAVIIKCCANVPFIVDPNSQAVEWLKAYVPNSETVLQQDCTY